MDNDSVRVDPNNGRAIKPGALAACEDLGRPDHGVQQLLAAWSSGGFDCVQSVECRFSEAERPIFARAGKAPLFEEACRVPAVLLCHLQRLAY